jgi:hypothetical protein
MQKLSLKFTLTKITYHPLEDELWNWYLDWLETYLQITNEIQFVNQQLQSMAMGESEICISDKYRKLDLTWNQLQQHAAAAEGK